ncbi:hypothetical protein GCM10023320_68510 [Pseudonocardia adelaidensis]|uniref:Cbb3-type cytochrome c oxidase subunit III n=1 Tax=Pseudonocardia adelaidensis TaxID=648754 RepID=A0ABP9NXY1_9PSEU
MGFTTQCSCRSVRAVPPLPWFIPWWYAPDPCQACHSHDGTYSAGAPVGGLLLDGAGSSNWDRDGERHRAPHPDTVPAGAPDLRPGRRSRTLTASNNHHSCNVGFHDLRIAAAHVRAAPGVLELAGALQGADVAPSVVL